MKSSIRSYSLLSLLSLIAIQSHHWMSVSAGSLIRKAPGCYQDGVTFTWQTQLPVIVQCYATTGHQGATCCSGYAMRVPGSTNAGFKAPGISINPYNGEIPAPGTETHQWTCWSGCPYGPFYSPIGVSSQSPVVGYVPPPPGIPA